MAFDPSSTSRESKASSPADSTAKLATEETSEANDTEGSILAWLQRADLRPSEIEQLSKRGSAMKSPKIRFAVVMHSRTPRHLTLTLLRQLYTFDLMRVSLAPKVPADIKHAAENLLLERLESISIGERLTLARRASGRIAASLLLDSDSRVMRAALNNSRLTEALVANAIANPGVTSTLVETVCGHEKWCLRHEVRIALLGCEKTPLGRILTFARELPAALVEEIVRGSKLPEGTRRYLKAELHISD